VSEYNHKFFLFFSEPSVVKHCLLNRLKILPFREKICQKSLDNAGNLSNNETVQFPVMEKDSHRQIQTKEKVRRKGFWAKGMKSFVYVISIQAVEPKILTAAPAVTC
jgi:hypothetical protein